MKKAMLIYNPLSRGAVGEGGLRRIKNKLRRGGISPSIREISAGGEARRLSAQAPSESFDMVICAGGDGTINEVVNGIACSNVPLGILPMGTGNVLAWEMGIPLNPLKACDVIIGGCQKRIDLCRANGRHFSCMAGVGFDAQVVKELDPAFKEMLGTAAYPLSGIRTLMHYGLPELTISIDGETETMIGYAAIICNSAHYGGRFKVCPEAVIDDGLMDVAVLQKRDAYALLHSGLTILFHYPTRGPGVAFRRARSARVSSQKDVPVQTDGDLVGTTPVNFSITPGALDVITPR